MEEVYMAFKRSLSKELRNKLKNEPLYKEKLLDDIYKIKTKDEKGRVQPIDKVFPAIRDGYIDFYYKGGRLFEYTDKGYATNLKYGFVCKDDENDVDVYETALLKKKVVENFAEGYDRIKERCALYNKVHESSFVAKLFDNYSYVTNNRDSDVTGHEEDDIVVLDVEAAFSNDKKTEKQKKVDKPDIVLFHKKEQLIKFVEAKLYSNDELSTLEKLDSADCDEVLSEKGMVPKVINQIRRYERQIKTQKEEIKEAYTEYINIVNDLFGLKLKNDDIKVCEEVGLIFFNYDGAHVQSDKYKRIKQTLESSIEDKRNLYPVGNTDNANLKQLFRCKK